MEKIQESEQVNPKIHHYIIAILALVLICAYPSLYLYFLNVDIAYFYEVVQPFGIYFAVAVVYFIICLIFTRAFLKSALAASLFMLCFSFYGFFDNAVLMLLPRIQVWHLLPIVFFTLFHINYFFIHKKFSTTLCYRLVLLLGFVYAVLILFNAINAIPQISGKLNRERDTPGSTSIASSDGGNEYIGTIDSYPNIYYFMFDEYASNDQMLNEYEYDNTAFTAFLEDNKFTVSYDSYNESGNTRVIIANIMALEYKFRGRDSKEDIVTAWKDNNLFPLLESFGYDILGVGFVADFGLTADESRLSSTTITGLDFTRVVLSKSMLGFLSVTDSSVAEQMKFTFDTIEHVRSLAPSPGNTFTLFYINKPHIPFVFDQYGERQDALYYENETDPKGYRDQFIYITKVMQEIAETILEKDPGSVIIFQSDHGKRFLYDAETGENIIEGKYKRHIFNAVYFRGEPLEEIKGMSGVNTWRIVLSNLLEVDLPILPMPGSSVVQEEETDD